MDSLTAIASRESIDVPAFPLDRFQSAVLKQLHLEFFFAKCRVLITPHLRFETTGESHEEEEAKTNLGRSRRHPSSKATVPAALTDRSWTGWSREF